MGRFQSFGHLFALAQGQGYRLDRHPTMSQHPVTPMDEADLGRHLAKQTDKAIGLVDFVAMKRGQADARLAEALAEGARVVSLDVLDEETLVEAGRLVWERGGAPVFGVGSQGLEAALGRLLAGRRTAAGRESPQHLWGASSASPACPARYPRSPQARSPTRSAMASPASASMRPVPWTSRTWEKEIGRATQEALRALSDGSNPLVFTATGPNDTSVAALRQAVVTAGVSTESVNDRIGSGLGRILDAVVREAKLRRVVISGGDTSSHAVSMLGIDALTAIAPVAPGSPLCRAHSTDPARDGLQIALKGGQVGGDDFFCAVRDGAS